MTPGTEKNRRKTVTFGAAVKDNEAKATASKSGIPDDCPGKFPSPWKPSEKNGEVGLRKTALTRTLENAREGKKRRLEEPRDEEYDTPLSILKLDAQADAETPADNKRVMARQAPKNIQSSTTDSFDGDMTLDLNEPHSQSGRYWKSEYERYHEDAKSQMKKLVRYKELAKSYAKKKDEEAIDLGEKLKEEQQCVQAMEDKVAELMAQLAQARMSGNEEDSPAMVKDLARQTALAVQYRNQVEQFRDALQKDGQSNNGLSSTDDVVIELKRAREQLREMGYLRAEMHNLKLNLSMAEKKSSRFKDENTKLAKGLTSAKEELESKDKLREIAEKGRENGIKLLVSLQKDYDNLKEQAKSQRREAEHLLKQRHDQVSELRKEISELKRKLESSSNDVENKAMATRAAKRPSQPEITAAADLGDLMSLETPQKPRAHVRRSRGNLANEKAENKSESTPEAGTYERPYQIHEDDDHLLDSRIPVLEGSTIKPRVSRAELRNAAQQSSTPMKSKYSALSEIINSANVPNSPAASNLPLAASFQERFSNLTIDSPRLPSPEPSLNYGANQARNQHTAKPSPRPSMYNLPDSSRRPLSRPRSLITENSGDRAGSIASTRLSSMASTRPRTTLSTERAAAAKARLEAKGREKLREKGKENA
jgi:hypothetical protein